MFVIDPPDYVNGEVVSSSTLRLKSCAARAHPLISFFIHRSNRKQGMAVGHRFGGDAGRNFPAAKFVCALLGCDCAIAGCILRARRPDTLQLQGAVKLLPASPLQGFLLGYVCGILWYCGNCYWVYSTMKQYGGISAAGAAGLLFLFSLYLGLYHGLFGLVVALIAKWSPARGAGASPFRLGRG